MKETLFFPWITLCALIILSANQSSALVVSEKGDDLIRDTCNKTTYYDLCVSALQSDPRSSSADMNGLARIMLELALANATDTLAYVQKLRKEATDRIMKQCLEICDDEYGLAVRNRLPSALRSLESKVYNNAIMGAGDVVDVVETCEESFTEPAPEVRKSPLTHRNEATAHLATLAVDICVILLG